MTIAFISDLHLTPQRPESTELFMSFLENADTLLEELYILGDLFEYWIGDDASDKLGHNKVESAIRSLADNRVKVYFIHGNRDFLINSEFAKRTGCVILPDPSIILLDDKPVLISHGDALCTDDVEHQQARKQMLSAKWKDAFLDKTIDQRITTAESMRSKSEREKQSKDLEIMDVNQNEVERVMQEHQVQTMIHGHTHRPAVHEFNLGGTKAKRYVLGDWYEQKSVLTYDNGTFLLKR